MLVEYCIKLQLSKAKKMEAQRGFFSIKGMRNKQIKVIFRIIIRKLLCTWHIFDNRRK